MQYIDEKFKEVSPTVTVEKIKSILQNMGIETEEKWHESGLENCWSLSLLAKGGIPASNGKGVSKDLARASAYGEFIERLQGGLFFYKFQGIGHDPEMNPQNYAPDIKYMTVDELEENGEWMDYLIQTYGGEITRKSLAKFCKLYACTEDEKILTIPFYSLFEDKYVYLPVGFVDQIYATNGCCAGNTREEAWVHALSEMMERRAALSMLTSGEVAPKIPEEVLKQYPVVMNIINQIRDSGKFDIEIFDYSIGNGFPIICTIIINKETQIYRVNVAADPVLEIAIQRSLTEMFQGKNIKKFTASHNGKILSKISDFSMVSNVINQLETGSGVYTADFFANEITCDRECTNFEDKSDKTNKELLNYMLDLYRATGKPVYVRNFSYLGFPCYRFVVPGFSEAVWVKLQDILPDSIAAEAGKILKDVTAADNNALSLIMAHSKMMSTVYSRYHNFGRMAGIPLVGTSNNLLSAITRSYAAYRLKSYDKAVKYLEPVTKSNTINEETKKYFACVAQYITLLKNGVEEEKVRVILHKFFESKYADKLYENIDKGMSPYDEFLLKCDCTHCDTCGYKDSCVYNECKELIIRVGNKYKKFVDGQNREEFA